MRTEERRLGFFGFRLGSHLQLQQRLEAVGVLEPVRAQVEVRQLRAGIEVVDTLQCVAADVQRSESSEPAAAPVQTGLAFETTD